VSTPEVVASAIVAIAALAVTALVLCKIIDKAEPALPRAAKLSP
jgi:hypothetical protein